MVICGTGYTDFQKDMIIEEKLTTSYIPKVSMRNEYLENIKLNLRKTNEKYKELQKEYHKILDENENLTWILEGNIQDRKLSSDECFALSKLVQINYDMKEIEEKEIFFLGCKELYFFLKKIEILK